MMPPPDSRSQAPCRPRRLNFVAAAIACFIPIMNSPNSAKADLSLPEWPFLNAMDSAAGDGAPAGSPRPVHSERPGDEADETASTGQNPSEQNGEADYVDVERQVGPNTSAKADIVASEEFLPGNPSAATSSIDARIRSDTADSGVGGVPGSAREARTRVLRESGILARQSEIGEGILLLERQLRHADMVARFMAVMGPAAPVEVSPGRFEDFSQIPEGRRLATELRERDLEAAIRELELQASVNRAKLRLKETAFDLENSSRLPAGNRNLPAAPTDLVFTSQPPEFSLRAIYGSDKQFLAIVEADGRRFEVAPGDALPGNSRVASIDETGIVVERDGATRTLKLFED